MNDERGFMERILREIGGIRSDLAVIKSTGEKTLEQAEKTNGRVDGLERREAASDVRVRTLEQEVNELRSALLPKLADLEPKRDQLITERDVIVFAIAVGVVATAVKWFQVLQRAADGVLP